MTAEIHVGDVGTVYKITVVDSAGVAVDVSGATTKNLLFHKPDHVTLTKTAQFFTTGVDGIIYYTFVAGDLDMPGKWALQFYFVNSAGAWYSNIVYFQVYENV
jgi:hypothetical protein